MAARPPKEVTAENERRAWELRQKGWKEQRIADELEVNVSSVSRMLKRVESRLAKEFTESAARIKARQTAQLEHIHEEALEQWERSCLDAEITRTVTKRVESKPKGRRDDDAEEDEEVTSTEEFLVEKTTEIRGQSGNAALLAQAREALSDIRDIWGLNAPKTQELSGPGGGPIAIREIEVRLTPSDDDQPSGESGSAAEEALAG